MWSSVGGWTVPSLSSLHRGPRQVTHEAKPGLKPGLSGPREQPERSWLLFWLFWNVLHKWNTLLLVDWLLLQYPQISILLSSSLEKWFSFALKFQHMDYITWYWSRVSKQVWSQFLVVYFKLYFSILEHFCALRLEIWNKFVHSAFG